MVINRQYGQRIASAQPEVRRCATDWEFPGFPGLRGLRRDRRARRGAGGPRPRRRGPRHGAGGCVILHGEPGIGKTALLDELVKQTDGIVLYSCGHEWEADLPYAALGDLLRPVLGELDHVPAPQARALRNALGIEASAGLDPVAVEVATASLLRVAAERAPLLVVVDDIPWIDTASRTYCCTSPGGPRTLVSQ